MSWLVTLLVVYAGIVAGMYLLQRQVLYYPAKSGMTTEMLGAWGIEEIFLTAADGIRLQAWWLSGEEGLPVLIYYHGNAGNLENRLDKLAAFRNAGFSVLALSYRGYGKSEGSPHEAGLYMDAWAALDYVQREKGVDLQRVMLYGESLGSGVAIQMATEYALGGVVLEAPYTSVVRRGAEIYPWLPVKYLMKDQYNSIGKIAQVKAPLLIFHNETDHVIPIRHGRALFAAANEPKQAYWLNGRSHVDFDWPDVAEKMKRFAVDQGVFAP